MTSSPCEPRALSELGTARNAGHRYTVWDAAYVVGSLSAGERREFEGHIACCQECRKSVTELAGMPALLSRLELQDVVALNELLYPSGTSELLSALLFTVRWARSFEPSSGLDADL